MIFIIDDDSVMAECIESACRPYPTKIFSNAIDAIHSLEDTIPDLIFLDIMLDGPDGFTLLNELVSYSDTSKIPVVIISSLGLADCRLEEYGVVGVLDKATMLPADIQKYAEDYAHGWDRC